MSDLRTRLARAICEADGLARCLCPNGNSMCDETLARADAVLAVLGSPSDADVERVARGIWEDRYPDEDWDGVRWLATETTDGGNGWYLTIMGHARAAIRALVGEAK